MIIKLLFSLCLTATLYGTIVGGIVYMINIILKKQLSGQFRFVLWFLPVFRLMFPYAPEAKFSIFNMFGAVPIAEGDYTPISVYPITSGRDALSSGGIDVFSICAVVWFIIMTAFLLWFIVPQVVLQVRMSRSRRYDDPLLGKILKECKTRIGIRRDIKPIIQDDIGTPAICGFIKPKLLLQIEIEELSKNEIKNIILHECCHCKRFDVISTYFFMIVQSIHWFNPFIWLFLFKARQEMEIATDEKALGFMEKKEQTDYGMTIIDTAAKFSVYGISGILSLASEKSNIKRRIMNIASFKRQSMILRTFSVMLILIIGSTCLTNARLPETLRPENNEIMVSGNTTESIWNGYKSKDEINSDTNRASDSNNVKDDESFNYNNGISNASSSNSADRGGNINGRNNNVSTVNYSSTDNTNIQPSESRSDDGSGDSNINIPPAIVNGTINADDTNSSSPSIVETDGNATEVVSAFDTDNSMLSNKIEARSKNLLPGTTFDDVEKSVIKEYGIQPKYFNVSSGENSIDVYPNVYNEINLYISSESSDVMLIDIYAGTDPAGRLLVIPRTFNSYTIGGLNEGQCYTLKVSTSANGIIMTY